MDKKEKDWRFKTKAGFSCKCIACEKHWPAPINYARMEVFFNFKKYKIRKSNQNLSIEIKF